VFRWVIAAANQPANTEKDAHESCRQTIVKGRYICFSPKLMATLMYTSTSTIQATLMYSGRNLEFHPTGMSTRPIGAL
jgi:hypothetical protein